MPQTDKNRIHSAERDRMQHAGNTAALISELGAMPDPSSLLSIRLNTFIERTYGAMEMDPETGAFVSGDVERLEFERDVAKAMWEFMVALKAQAEKMRAAPKLLLPADTRGKPGLVMPGAPDPTAVVQ